ncbi:tetratricopeptide repeat protein [Kitasatospora sp. LaBMicrA B282]|uniref:tetratricopeptide repeat protein n=1 Tax=Kitasatospora sp. LaBMicrA B282 TaxID=3420949 RepID=UPI003D1463A7
MSQERVRLSRGEALQRRGERRFVGRRAELTLFTDNLAKDPDPQAVDPAEFLFHVRGVGGIGKSTLLARWRQEAERAGAVTALVDEYGATGVEAALVALAEQLAGQPAGQPAGPDGARKDGGRRDGGWKDFEQAVQRHRRTQHAAGEPGAGGEAASLPARVVAQAALGAAGLVPGGGAVAAMTNPQLLAQSADRLAGGIHRRRARGHGDTGTAESETALCRAFVTELRRLCERRPGRRVVLFLDTWERTGQLLDAWLRELLTDGFGRLPLEVTIVLAGRDALAERDWAPLRDVVVDVPLELFTDQEARELLAARGVADPGAVAAVLQASLGLPLLVALLAHTRPGSAGDVAVAGGDAVDRAVERFLQWVPEPERREVLLAAALPRQLNRDVFAAAGAGAGGEAGGEAWEWLLGQPFVTGHGEFKQFHAVVRASLLRHQRAHSPELWRAGHARLAEWHAAARQAGGPRRRMEELYHRVCADPAADLGALLEETARSTGGGQEDVIPWAAVLRQAAQDGGDAEVQAWADRIRHALTAPEPVLETLTALTAATLPPRVRAAALAQRGHVHYLADRDDAALTDLDQAVALDAGLARPLAYRGELHGWHRRFDEALADLDAAHVLAPRDAWVLVVRGEVHWKAGQPAEAMRDLTAALAIRPQHVRALTVRGAVHRTAGRREEAVQDLTSALAIDPRNAWALAQRGEVHRLAGRPEEAVQDLTAALAIRPQDSWALGSRGAAHLLAGRLAEALADLTSAIALDPRYSWALTYRGETHRQAGHLEEALADLTSAIALDPQDARALAQRGATHRQAGRLAEALEDLTSATALTPQDAWALAQRGEAFREAGRSAEAIADFTAAIALGPQSAWALGSRGQAHAAAQQLAEAVADLTEALAIAPDTSWVACELVAVHRRRGDLPAARAVLDEVVAAEPDDAAVRLESAMTLLYEAGLPGAVDAWTAYAAAPCGDDAFAALDRAVQVLLHGLVLGQAEPAELVDAFLGVPRTNLAVPNLRARVAELAGLAAPVGPRAAAALALLG